MSNPVETNGDHAATITTLPTDTIPVVIVGAGPVGMLLALRLAQSGIRSVVLEKEKELSQAPRAIGYYGPVHTVFQEAGIYDRVAREGMPSGGYMWRKLPVNEVSESGKIVGKKLGPVLGRNVMSRPDANGQYEVGHYSIQLAQSQLAALMLEEAEKTGNVQVFWQHEVTGLEQDDAGITATVAIRDGSAGSTATTTAVVRGQYLAACDGGRSTVRKLLGIRMQGHSWSERFVATDVLRKAPVVADPPVHFVVDARYWAVVTPLEHVEAGRWGLWRYSMAVPAAGPGERELTDDEVMSPEHVDQMLLQQIDGPRPSDHVLVRKSLYKMHQLLASTMHRGRCFLAGDAAHINNPIGGLGLCSGLLDADALYQTLDIVLNGRAKLNGVNGANGTNGINGANCTKHLDDQALFRRYSAERRRVFQCVIHPLSSANKMRLQAADPDATAQDDWYLQALARGDKEELMELNAPLYREWRTNMRKWA